MSTISLTVSPVAGSKSEDIFVECIASALAATLGLAWVSFKFNGCTAEEPPDDGWSNTHGLNPDGTTPNHQGEQVG